jgi:hypothetical protein
MDERFRWVQQVEARIQMLLGSFLRRPAGAGVGGHGTLVGHTRDDHLTAIWPAFRSTTSKGGKEPGLALKCVFPF